MSESPTIEVVSWNLNRETLYSIRNKVFTEEQGIAEDLVFDDSDDTATHFLVTNEYIALGCGRLLPDGKIGRMAVLPEHRGQGLGRAMLDGIVEHARRSGYRRLYLHAQAQAAGFYEAAGFQPVGEPFEEAGIPHSAMEMLIDYSVVEHFVSGIEYPEPFATLAQSLAESARRNIRIYSATLDHDVFDRRELAAAMSALARRGRLSEVKILVNDVRPMVSRGHRLLEIARRLSSTITIRVLPQHPELPDATYLVRDHDGVVYKPDERGGNGFYEPDSRASAKRFVDSFDVLWRQGQTDPRLRQLTL